MEEDDLFCPECGCRIPDKAKETDTKIPENNPLSSLEKELNLLIEMQEEEENEYNADIKKARDYCNSGQFAEAGKIYEKLVLTYPEDMNGYMGLLRVASENYTIPEGENVEKALRVTRRMAKKEDLSEFDLDYPAFEKRIQERILENKRKEEKQKRLQYLKQFEIDGSILRRYKGKESRVEIPIEVTVIGREAFKDCNEVTDSELDSIRDVIRDYLEVPLGR